MFLLKFIFFFPFTFIIFCFDNAFSSIYLDQNSINCCSNGTKSFPFTNFIDAFQNISIASNLEFFLIYSEKPYEFINFYIQNYNIEIKSNEYITRFNSLSFKF